jgi:6,7-dimethyl-8-ribityllumazine synthase
MPSTRYDDESGTAGAPIAGTQVIAGNLDAGGMRIGIVVSRFNGIITKKLLDGAVESLRLRGIGDGDIDVVWVPGAFEIPIAARELAKHGRVDAVVCLGAVIRGDTAHFEFVAGEAAQGIASVHVTTGVPATFGVLTVDTIEQAHDRAGGKHGNKGAEAADNAVEMVSLLRGLRRGHPPEEQAEP